MLSFGVVGTNWITEAFMQAARETGEVEIAAVYSRTEERAAEFAEKHAIPYAYSDLEEMARSEHVDAVYIASPNSFHAEHAIRCMKHGKHVLCEKPIASNARELERMTDAAAAYDVLLMEAVKSTHMPAFQAIREHLPKIGAVRRYMASFCQYSSRYDAYKQGKVLNAFNPEYSNGALMDLGVYCLYPMAVLFGSPERVQANAVLLESGVDGEGSILMSYAGMEAVVMYSKITSSSLPSEIQGENGSLIIDKISEPQTIQIRYRDGSVEDLSIPVSGHTMAGEVRAFARAVRQNARQTEINSHDHSRIVTRIMDQARSQIGLVYPADRE